MAHFLVKARPHNLEALRALLDSGDIMEIQPSGGEMQQCLNQARITEDGWATWEENCYCNPPLYQERKDLLNDYFTEITTERLKKGEGWSQIEDLPSLWG